MYIFVGRRIAKLDFGISFPGGHFKLKVIESLLNTKLYRKANDEMGFSAAKGLGEVIFVILNVANLSQCSYIESLSF